MAQDRAERLERFYQKYPLERADVLYHIDTMFLPFQNRYERLNPFADHRVGFGVDDMFAREQLNYNVGRLFHSTFKMRREGSVGFVLQELPLGEPSWFSFLEMSDAEIEYWRDDFLWGLDSNFQTIVDPVYALWRYFVNCHRED